MKEGSFFGAICGNRPITSLTLPSRERFPAYGLQAPLMSNVRPLVLPSIAGVPMQEAETAEGSVTKLELEKLRLEVHTLKRPFWKDPKIVGSVVAFLISVGFNAGQFLDAKSESLRRDRELSIKQEEWTTQRQKVEAEVQRLKQQIAASERTAAGCASADAELDQIAKDIAYLNQGISREKAEVTEQRLQLAKLERQGQTAWIESARRGIATVEGWAEKMSALLEQAIKRRSELEQRCR
jgi:septal ring factor EnvC (AmiA/AmiB activator)